MNATTGQSQLLYKSSIIGLCLIASINIFTILFALFASSEPYEFGKIDALEYWSAFKVFIAGGNPYSDIQMLDFQSNIRKMVEPIMMWNPPWLLTAFAPLLQVDSFPLFCVLWFVFSLLAYLAACFILIKDFASDYIRDKALWILIFSFPALTTTLVLGQVSNWILLGLALILSGIQKKYSLQISVGLLLISLKPHLVLALLPLIATVIFKNTKNPKEILKVLSIPSIFILSITLAYPELLRHWLLSASGSSELTVVPSTKDWATTTLPSVFISLTGLKFNYAIYTTITISLMYLALLKFKIFSKMQFTDRFSFILLISLPLSCFAWFYDYVVILPGLIILWDRLTVRTDLIRLFVIFQTFALVYSSRFMPQLQYGMIVVLPVCVLLAFQTLKLNEVDK